MLAVAHSTSTLLFDVIYLDLVPFDRLTFGRGFGKNLDQTIQKTSWHKALLRWQQWLVARCLDVAHHWWMGALLMLYVVNLEMLWFGAGLFVDDLPDVPRRVKELFQKF